MATNFPTSLDNFTNPSSGNTLDSPSHSLQHSDANDAIEAIEAKLGVGASPAGSATSGYVLTAGTGGTTTWSIIPTQGLVQIVPTSVSVGSGSGSVDANGNVTFSSASSISINGCFSSSYANYRMMIKLSAASADATINFRIRKAGTDTTTGYYMGGYRVTFLAGGTLVGLNNQATWNLGDMDTSNANIAQSYSIDIFNPNESRLTNFNAIGWGQETSGNTYWFSYGGSNTDTTAIDGFTIYPSAGNIGGIIRVYGYRN